MPLLSDAYYRDLAQEALRTAGVIEPPVMVEAVAASLGVPLQITGLPRWFSGAILYEEGLPLILLNADADEASRRRTLGHLLGHILVVLHEPGGTYPRAEQDHRVADIVAEEMMLPTFMIAEQARKWFNDYRYLARLFGVSEPVMIERMQALGLLKHRGLIWDY